MIVNGIIKAQLKSCNCRYFVMRNGCPLIDFGMRDEFAAAFEIGLIKLLWMCFFLSYYKFSIKEKTTIKIFFSVINMDSA